VKSLRGTYQAGVTLLEVTIAAALATLLVAGLAAATISASRAHQETATTGNAERAIHETLERIGNDLRRTNGLGTYRCGQSGSESANGHDVTWSIHRVTLASDGSYTTAGTCGTIEQQSALRISGHTLDRGVRHEREVVVGLSRGAAATISTFAADPLRVRPNEPVTLTWQLAPHPPAGTIVTLNGQNVPVDPVTLNGSIVVRPQISTTYTLNADSPQGATTRSLDVAVGNAPLFLSLRAVPERYIPGQPLTLEWSIDPRPLRLSSASYAGAGGIPNYTIPVGSGGLATGSRTGTVSASATGTLSFPFIATSEGGTSRKTLLVQECPLPSASLTASATSVQSGTSVQITWSSNTAVSGTYAFDSNAPSSLTPSELATGTRTHTLTAPAGSTRTYTFTVTFTSDCGRTTTRSVSVTAGHPPTVSLTLDANPIPANSSTTARWSVSGTNVTNVCWHNPSTASPGECGLALTGSRTVSVTTSPVTVRVRAVNAFGTTNREATLDAQPDNLQVGDGGGSSVEGTCWASVGLGWEFLDGLSEGLKKATRFTYGYTIGSYWEAEWDNFVVQSAVNSTWRGWHNTENRIELYGRRKSTGTYHLLCMHVDDTAGDCILAGGCPQY
jgi:type II secretory pathway component PulJ